MKEVKKYAQLLVKRKAIDEILKDLHAPVLRELKQEVSKDVRNAKQIVEGVEFHLTLKATKKYAKDIADVLKDLKQKMEEQKKRAEDAGKVRVTKTETFDAEIPKSAEKEVYSRVAEYKKYFR